MTSHATASAINAFDRQLRRRGRLGLMTPKPSIVIGVAPYENPDAERGVATPTRIAAGAAATSRPRLPCSLHVVRSPCRAKQMDRKSDMGTLTLRSHFWVAS